MRFNPNLLELIPASHLGADFGGEFPYEFEPKSYWDQIVAYVVLIIFLQLHNDLNLASQSLWDC
jgi:hypothetical protein